MRRTGQLVEAGRAGAGIAWDSGLIRPLAPTTLGRMASAGLRHGPAASALLGLAAARWPSRTCIIDDDTSLTFSQVYVRAGRLAGALRARGVSRDSRVGVMCRNHCGFVIASFASMWTDADLVLLNTDFGGAQLGGVVASEELDVLIFDSEFSGVVAASGFTGLALIADADATGPGSTSELEEERRSAPRGGGRHGRLVILTSGTTGAPKGSKREPEAVGAIAPISSLLRSIGLHSGDTVLILPPLFHGFGLAYLLMALTFGCPVAVVRRFDASDVLQRVERDRVNVLFSVPVMLSRLLDVPPDERARFDLSTLRAVQSGAAPLSADLASRFMDEFGDVLHDVYGSTETGWSTIANPDDLRRAPGTVGRPLRGVSVRILDGDDEPVGQGEVGVVFVDSGMTAPDYTNGGGKRVVDAHVSTGDLGHLDESGRLFIDGRDDDMIVSGGENVFPSEVENLLESQPAIREAYVLGVADDEFGQRLRAFVVLDVGAELTSADVRAFVRDRLARYKVPRDVEFVEALERTVTGKVKRVR
ncbi:AMP-binding protein [Aeromicrobium sp.]|uniref:AMP-binding protein n=1 Tax=Aeromicrobium sp. TaxID=1871063 RepID=UPI0019B025D4|nr:AMP-binding protein [Aeromicrobium sp.]MBC7630063.1 AMP-binding protein [Aeromicrobium sp.]